MPICAAVLFYEAVSQSDIIIGFFAFGILRSWLKDVLDDDDVPKGKIIGRICRWALLGGIFEQLWVATKPEEYIACFILLIFVWAWKKDKLGVLWNPICRFFRKNAKVEQVYSEPKIVVHEKVRNPKRVEKTETVIVERRKFEPAEPALKNQDELEKIEKYKKDAEKAVAEFLDLSAQKRINIELFFNRLAKIEGGH